MASKKSVEACQSSNAANEQIVDTTSFCDLNDDCLRTVCEYMHPVDLCTFADVCHRFRIAARANYQSPNCSLSKNLDLSAPDDSIDDIKFNILRNFGASINSLTISACGKNDKFVIDRLVRNCSGTLNGLTMRYFNIDKKTGKKLMSLILGLKELRMADCKVEDCRVFLCHFPKLEKVSCEFLNLVQFEKFLMKNPQLKYIVDLIFDERRFVLIVKHLPDIETLSVSGFNYEGFVDDISTLKKIKTLSLIDLNRGGKPDVIKKICENLVELAKFSFFGSDCNCWKMEDFLMIIRSADKLQELHYSNSDSYLIIDGDFFMRIVDIVEARNREKRLKISLGRCYGVEMKIPKDLVEKYQHVLTFNVQENENFAAYLDSDDNDDESESDPEEDGDEDDAL